jgi:hypothetical protein
MSRVRLGLLLLGTFLILVALVQAEAYDQGRIDFKPGEACVIGPEGHKAACNRAGVLLIRIRTMPGTQCVWNSAG